MPRRTYPHTCRRCGETWPGLVPDPVACARCGSAYWRTAPRNNPPLTCRFCGRVTANPQKREPVQCPYCHRRGNRQGRWHDAPESAPERTSGESLGPPVG